MSSTHLLTSQDIFTIVFRLCMALMIGAIVGLERQFRHKAAGLRTHMLVSLASALFTLIPLLIAENNSNFDGNALSRVIQGITAGVGFLGAGEILREASANTQRMEVKGLTSAAAIWVSAALGISAGCGLWQLGLIGAILCFCVLYVFKQFERG